MDPKQATPTQLATIPAPMLREMSVAEARAAVKRFNWTRKKISTAHLVAKGETNAHGIADQMGIRIETLIAWKRHPEFRQLVKQIQDTYLASIMIHGIASKARRLQVLDQRWQKMQQVIEERSHDPALQHVPGGTTGLVTMQLRVIGKGKDVEVIEEYQVDVGLLKELREHEKQAAGEVDQLTGGRGRGVGELGAGNGDGNSPITFTIPLSDHDDPIIIDNDTQEIVDDTPPEADWFEDDEDTADIEEGEEQIEDPYGVFIADPDDEEDDED